MNKVGRVLVGVAAVAAVAAVWWLSTPQDVGTPRVIENADPVAADEAVARITAATIAQIEIESARDDAAPSNPSVEAVAPPDFVPATTDLPDRRSQASLPEGYTVTVFHGEMAKARMTPLDQAAGPDVTAEYAWLASNRGVDGLVAQAMAAGRDWTFGWIGVEADTDVRALGPGLRALGAEILGRSGALLRARLPGDAARLEEIAGLPGVAGLAPTPAESKLPRVLSERARAHPAQDLVPTFVTLMTGDPDGRWRQALADLGGVVGAFDPSIRTYVANFPYAVLDTVAAADFVLAVEPVGMARATHDTAVPAMGADALRLYDNETGLFSGVGGESVTVGVMDTGLNISHEDISTGRRSICGANFATLFSLLDRQEDQDLWIDDGQHGTHVTGTIVGNGTGAPQFAGMAPLVQDIRFAKVLTSFGAGSLIGITRGMDFLSRASTCGPAGTPEAKPLLVSVSLGQSSPEWDGRSAAERKLDATVWNSRQLYVVAQANESSEAYGNLASAKNSLAVGAVEDGGDLANFSSLGPTADGRLQPQVVGTGVKVYSARGEGRHSGYQAFSGTSMATPSVAGVAALLMDAAPEFREQPAAVRARLMASAIKPDAFLEDINQFPLHNSAGPGPLQHRYGLGKVSARTSVLNRDQSDGWVSGSAIVEIGDGEYGYRDIEVPEGASRLDIAMTWDERAADTLSSAVLNDLDLWVDRDVDCAPTQPAACGNAASRSTRDNVEWLILRDPPAGTYRLKVVAKYARVDAPRAALAWTVIRGPSTPQLAVSVDTGAVSAEPGAPFEVQATLTTDGYVAAGTMLRVDCRGADGSAACERIEFVAAKASDASREDNVTRTLRGESGDAIALGELAVGETQTVKLVFNQFPAADRFRLYLTASAWNAASASASVDVAVGASEVGESAPVAPPANDHFANAEELTGDSGRRDFDLLLATPEPGEPVFTRGLVDDFGRYESQRRPRSIWYRWTAPTTDIVRFTIPNADADDIADDVQLDVYEMDGLRLADLVHIGVKSGGGMTFAARRGETYAIRLSITKERLFEYDEPGADGVVGAPLPADVLEPVRRRVVPPLAMHWQPATLPDNDNFESATALAGETGELAGSNLSATEQSGERLQPLAATTWYRWTAPADGDVSFHVDRRYLKVAVFSGDDVGDLRLVSGAPGQMAVFPAGAGIDYTVVVGADSAYTSGSDYTLSWGPGQRAGGNDDMARAQPMLGAPAFFHFALADFSATTVEPGEPPESGVRTAWWTWTAPFTSRYTWRAAALFDETLALAIFEVNDALVPLGESSGHLQTEQLVSFDATAGKQYLISAGLPTDQALVNTSAGPISFEWGPSPGNDDLATAAALAGSAGTVIGSNQFATVERGEQVGLLGDSSVWWTWDIPETHWYRIALNDPSRSGVVAVYKVLGDGGLGNEPVAVSRELPDPILVFRAEVGERYAIRVGSGAGSAGNAFGLSWQPNGSPAWLRYAGSIADGDVDPSGNILELGSPDSITFNGDGSQLYVATESGLQVYQRHAGTGALTHLQTLEGVDERTLLFWDAHTSSVIAAGCTALQKFAATDAGAGLEPATPVAGAIPCLGDRLAEGSVLRDSSGTFVHFISPVGIATLSFNEDRTELAFVGGVPVFGISAAEMGTSEEFLYGAADEGLHVFARDPGTGALAHVGTVRENPPSGLAPVRLLTTEPSGRYLFGVTVERSVAAFDLADPAVPAFVVQSEPVEQDSLLTGTIVFLPDGLDPFASPDCSFAATRQNTMTVDVMCREVAMSRRLFPAVPAMRQEELLRTGGVDAFHNNLPLFSISSGIAASPDGGHIYASAPRGIMIFERAGSR